MVVFGKYNTDTMLKRRRKVAQGEVSSFTRKINELEMIIKRAKKEGYPQYVLDDYNKSLKNLMEAKRKFIAYAKATNKLRS